MNMKLYFCSDKQKRLYLKNKNEKTIRQIEDKLYCKLKINNFGFDYIKTFYIQEKRLNKVLKNFQWDILIWKNSIFKRT